MQFFRTLCLFCLAVALAVGCGGDGGGPTAPETSGSIRINNTSTSLSIRIAMRNRRLGLQSHRIASNAGPFCRDRVDTQLLRRSDLPQQPPALRVLRYSSGVRRNGNDRSLRSVALSAPVGEFLR